MAAEAVAGALDADDDGVVQEAVQQRCGDDGIAEHLAPTSHTPPKQVLRHAAFRRGAQRGSRAGAARTIPVE